MEESTRDVSVQTKWVRLGLLIALLHYAFLVLVIFLLNIDLVVAAVVAIVVSIGGGVALMIYVLYRY